MNLHGIVRGTIRSVNPDIDADHLRSTGHTTSADGKRAPTYSTVRVRVQVQPVSSGDIVRLNGLGVQGVMRRVYDYGNQLGIVRADGKGGDMLRFSQTPGAPAQNWKVAHVEETWPDWSSVIVVLQS